jgi:hypothetical protein
MMKRLRALSLGGLVTMLSIPGLARADGTAASDEQKAAARMLGTDGVKLAMSGDCPHAVDKLTRAEALVHAPTTAVWLGQCDIQIGHLVAGTEVLNRVLRETLPDGSPKSWVDAKQHAQSLFDAAEPRIAKLTIHVDRPPGVDVQVTVDGEQVPSVLLDNERPTDPGPHHILALAQGFSPVGTDVSLSDGQSQQVSLRLVGTPSYAAAPPPSQTVVTPAPPPPNQPPPPSSPSGPNRTPAIVTFAIGGAGLVVGSIFGVLALSDKSRLDSADGCPKSCPASSQSDISAMSRDSLISTIGIGVGVVGAALGTYFLVSARSDDSVNTARTARIDVRPWVALGSAGVGGTFP